MAGLQLRLLHQQEPKLCQRAICKVASGKKPPEIRSLEPFEGGGAEKTSSPQLPPQPTSPADQNTLEVGRNYREIATASPGRLDAAAIGVAPPNLAAARGPACLPQHGRSAMGAAAWGGGSRRCDARWKRPALGARWKRCRGGGAARRCRRRGGRRRGGGLSRGRRRGGGSSKSRATGKRRAGGGGERRKNKGRKEKNEK